MKHKEQTLGLDISTSIIGICILNKTQKIVLLDHIDLRKIKGFWKKIDFTKIKLNEILKKYKPSSIVIEEPLKKSRRGKSSINTIILLQKFNAILSYICKEITNVEPSFISPIEARKLIGIKLLTLKICKKTHKKQTFDFVLENKLINKNKMPLTRNGTYQKYCFDMVDAFVVALASFKK